MKKEKLKLLLVEAQSKVLEYEHSLEHIAECETEPNCTDCQNLAKGALARDNKNDFMDLAIEMLFWDL